MSDGILLRGLDGSNPLAFLAALGTLRTLSLALPDESVKMSWEQFEGAWRPRVFCSLAADSEKLAETLCKALHPTRESHPTRLVNYQSGNAEATKFYQAVREGKPIDSEFDSWVTALTSDVHPDATSPLQLTRSDYFVGNLDQIIANTTADHIGKTLFFPWRYADRLSGQSLHLDPSEDRRHAYQWNKPSGDPNRNNAGNMLGANRLAIEAMPLFLGLPSTNPERLLMTGWTGVRAVDATWTWPVWSTKSSLDVVRSIIAIDELQASLPNRCDLVARGVDAVYRCRRILGDKTPNLTPSQCVV